MANRGFIFLAESEAMLKDPYAKLIFDHAACRPFIRNAEGNEFDVDGRSYHGLLSRGYRPKIENDHTNTRNE